MNIADSYGQETALVTGGTGFVGRWLVETLKKRGSQVTVLARESGIRSESLPDGGEVARGSLQDFRFLSRLFSTQRIDTVFHLAAQPLIAVSRKLPRETLEANVAGTWNLLEAMRLSGVGQMVVASSDKAYAQSLNLASGRTMGLQIDPYSASKICAEMVARTYASTFGLRVAIARFSNIYGGGDLNFSRLVPDLVRSTLNGERLVIRSDGKSRVNLLYVKDAVKAFLLLASRLKADPSLSGRAFNFAMASEISVLGIVDRVLDLVGRQDLKPIVAGAELKESNKRNFESAEACEILGWRPDYSLDAGLKETIAWYRSHLQELPRAPVVEQAMAGQGIA